MHRVRWRFGLCIALFLSTLAGPGAAAESVAAPSHYRDGGFQNNYIEFEPKGLGALLRWRADALRDGLPKPPQTPTPVVAADLAYLRTNAAAGLAMEPAITWIGHATMLVQAGAMNILTDPMFSQRASPLAFIGPKRHVDPGIALAELPRIDVVLISHNHYDHLDDASVQALAAQPGGSPLFIVPLGLKAWFAQRDISRVVELDWWQSHTVGALEVVLTPVQHWSGRGLTDRMATLWGGYALFAPDFHVFFAGDTAYSPDFAEIRARFAARQTPADGGGFDVALLPIGAYEPRWFMKAQHVDPAEAVQIHLDLQAKQSIGMHWGTFELSDESLDRPPIDLAAARHARGLADSAFSVLAIGETRRFERRRPRRRVRREASACAIAAPVEPSDANTMAGVHPTRARSLLSFDKVFVKPDVRSHASPFENPEMPSTDSHWEAFGKVDPYFGVLTDPKYRKVTSDDRIRDEFFSTGSHHVESMLAVVERYLQPGFAPSRVLDFGCGVGRLTIPLSQRAGEVVGVDVSESMLAEARRNCDRAGVTNVAFVKSDDRLSEVTGTFDLLHSFIVFQHIPPVRGTALFSAMLPRLAEGGIGILHFTYWIPNASSRTLARRMYAAARTGVRRAAEFVRLLPRKSPSGPIMEMNAYDIGELLGILQDSGCHRIHLRFTDHGGPRGVVMFFQKERLPSM